MSIPRIAVTTNPDVSVQSRSTSRAGLPPIRLRANRLRACRSAGVVLGLAARSRSSPGRGRNRQSDLRRFGRFGADLAICDRDEQHLETSDRAAQLRLPGRHGLLDVRDSALVDAFGRTEKKTCGKLDRRRRRREQPRGFSAAFLDVRPVRRAVRENFTS